MINYKRYNKKYNITVTQGIESNIKYLITPVHTCPYSEKYYKMVNIYFTDSGLLMYEHNSR